MSRSHSFSTLRLVVSGGVLLCLFFLAACSGSTATPAPTPAPLPQSMKGWELYSWEQAGDWHFSLLIGTNRQKTVNGIISNADAVRGTAALKQQLGRLPHGEQVTWNLPNVPGFSMPPLAIVRDIRQFSVAHGVLLQVSD